MAAKDVSGPLQIIPFTPTTSLPPLRSLAKCTTQDIGNALQNVGALYFPPRPPPVFDATRVLPEHVLHDTSVPDSGYASEDEFEADDHRARGLRNPTEECPEEDARTFDIDVLRSDTFEREFCIRWLTGFTARSDTWVYDNTELGEEEARADLVDCAARLLALFAREGGDEDDREPLVRRFSFFVGGDSGVENGRGKVEVELGDAPLLSEDHTSVGLQSWASSIVLAEKICANPTSFGLSGPANNLRVLELGAGTGLLSIVVAKLLLGTTTTAFPPSSAMQVIATDYHPSVLENLEKNVCNNIPSYRIPSVNSPVKVVPLDWEHPTSEPPLDKPFDVILAADVIYQSEHARWIRDCVQQILLRPGGVFWLIIPVRSTGRHEGMGSTVEAVFPFVAGALASTIDGSSVLAIRSKQEIGRQEGVGRADESSYLLYEIGWV